MSLISATLGRLIPRYRTVAEWAEIYAKVVAAKPIEDKTKANRASNIRRIVAQFGDRRIGAVRAHEVGAYIHGIAAEQSHLARRLLIETRDMFREAVNYGWIDRDPTLGVRAPRVRVRRLRLTLEQWQAMHDWAVDHSPPWVPPMLMLALVTGQRRGDIRTMRFADVWDEQIGDRAVPHLHIEQQKTGVRIAIPLELRLDALDCTVGQVIDDCRRYTPAANDDGYLVRKSTGEPPVPASMSWRFEQAREAALPPHRDPGVPPSLHECRSLAARLYDDQGVADVQTLLGHTDASMTELYKDDRGLSKRAGKWRRVQL